MSALIAFATVILPVIVPQVSSAGSAGPAIWMGIMMIAFLPVMALLFSPWGLIEGNASKALIGYGVFGLALLIAVLYLTRGDGGTKSGTQKPALQSHVVRGSVVRQQCSSAPSLSDLPACPKDTK